MDQKIQTVDNMASLPLLMTYAWTAHMGAPNSLAGDQNMHAKERR